MAFLTYWHLKETKGARAKKQAQEYSKAFKAATNLKHLSIECNSQANQSSSLEEQEVVEQPFFNRPTTSLISQ